MKRLFLAVVAAALVGAGIVPALAAEGQPARDADKQAKREAWCKENPEKCKEVQAKMKERQAQCKADPEKCKAERQAKAEEWCKANPEKCKEMKAHHEQCKANPEKCRAERQAKMEERRKHCEANPADCPRRPGPGPAAK